MSESPNEDMVSASFAGSLEAADEIIGHFSRLHPGVTMTFLEWADLREMIQRQILGLFEGATAAKDLATDRLYLSHRRTALPSDEPMV